MNEAALKSTTKSIVVDEIFPHSPEVLWKTLTTPEMMGRWLMTPTGFEPKVGNLFIYKTTPAGQWDGLIRCEVIEAIPNEQLTYAWRGGHPGNEGYGSLLDTLVSFTLAKVQGGTRLSLVHSGFDDVRNDTAYCKMSEGWPKVLATVSTLASEVI